MVILTSTVPVPAGAVALIDVALFTVKVVAADAPKVTAVAPVKLAPVIVIDVPPADGPLVGDRLLTVGAGDAVPSTWTVTRIRREIVLSSIVKVSVPEKVDDGGL